MKQWSERGNMQHDKTNLLYLYFTKKLSQYKNNKPR
jgi:hypothetical protein